MRQLKYLTERGFRANSLHTGATFSVATGLLPVHNTGKKGCCSLVKVVACLVAPHLLTNTPPLKPTK